MMKQRQHAAIYNEYSRPLLMVRIAAELFARNSGLF